MRDLIRQTSLVSQLPCAFVDVFQHDARISELFMDDSILNPFARIVYGEHAHANPCVSIGARCKQEET